ncbi:hypothetical protein [uncultured Roseovarius sp.]|uniref:hypothetical protein n=1 Tax=uncultured Roseovarius sp. TaxID=293344 RepID=UPI00263621F1|nr:hypothetical protein [uncultured Roseovarius sp.]
MGDCEGISCYLEQLRVLVKGFAQNTGINTFWLYFIIGAVALLLFSRDRLDRSLKQRDKAGDGSDGQPLPSGENHDFEAFVRTFRPSEICISRAFRRAWISYAVILVALYSAASFIIALMAGVMTWEQAIAGLSGNDQAQTTIASGQPQTRVAFLSTFEVSEIESEATAEAVAPKQTQDIAEWPLLVALMVVGLIPAIPGVARIEHGIRNFSLELAGIPRDVVDLWKQLGGTPMLPDPADQREVLLAALSNGRGAVIDSALNFAGRFLGEAETAAARDDLALAFLFLDWTSGDKPWPDKEIQTLYSRGDLEDIAQSVSEIEKDLRHFVAVNTLIERKAGATAVPTGWNDPGVRFRGPGFTPPVDGEIEGIDLQGRWADLSGRAAKVADQVRAKVALYAERVDVLRKDGLLVHLYDWIERAKAVTVNSDGGESRRSHHTGVVLLCTLIYALFGVFVPFVSDYFSGAPAPDEPAVSRVLRYTWTKGFPWAMEALACFLAASLAVKSLRDTPALRLDWRRFRTSGWGWDYAKLALTTAVVAVFLILLANWLAQFASVSAENRFTARTLPWLLLDPRYWFNGLHLAALTASSVVLALVVALISDLHDQSRSIPRLLIVTGGGLMALAVFKFLEFAVPVMPLLLNDAVPLNDYFGAGERYELMAFVIVASIWVYQRARARDG